MMRWTPADMNGVREVAGSARADAVPETTSRIGDETTVRYLLDAVVAAVASLGARSVVVALVMAMIVATLLFGLTANEAAAYARWCRAC